jgi:hypothetical protein
MNNNRKIAVVGGIFIVMLVFVWIFSGGSNDQPGGKPVFRSSNWTAKFQPFDKSPLGLYLFHTLAQTHIGKQDMYMANDWIQLDSIMSLNDKPKTYMFAGNLFGLANKELDSIMLDVQNGSDLFLSYNKHLSNVPDYFFDKYEYRFDYAETENVFTPKHKVSMINLHQKDTIACDWMAFGDVHTRGPSKSLSSFMQMDNFISIKMGKGMVYLHTNPNMFYNYQIKRNDGFRYTRYVLNQLPDDQDIVLLELGRRSDNYGDYDIDEQSGDQEGKEDTSYLRFIFENATLRNAMLLAILGLILFVVFRSKRKRPIVPFQEKKKDMTLAFTETITSIYYSKRNPYVLLQIQRKNFYAAIHKHFFVDLQRRDGDKELRILSEKSNKSIEEIKSIITILETKNASGVTEQTISDVAKKQRKFYKDVGIITENIEQRTEEREMTFRRSLLLPSLMILIGLFSITLGLYYLVSSIGVGIVLWPIGMVLTALGVIRLSNPYMVVDKDTIVYFTVLGRKKVYKRDEFIRTEIKTSGAVLIFSENRQLIINYWDLSRFDKMQFERFISKLHKLEL